MNFKNNNKKAAEKVTLLSDFQLTFQRMELCSTAVWSTGLPQALGPTLAEPSVSQPGWLPCQGSKGVFPGSVKKQCPGTVSAACPMSARLGISIRCTRPSRLVETTVNTPIFYHLNLTSGAMLNSTRVEGKTMFIMGLSSRP